jgi:SH3 domain-containing protein
MVDDAEPAVCPARSQGRPASVSSRRRVWMRVLLGLPMLAVLAACNATTTSSLHVRSAPNANSASLTTIATSGTPVAVTCYVAGQPVHGNRTWYRVSSPTPGYVSGYYVTHGTAGSTTSVPHC